MPAEHRTPILQYPRPTLVSKLQLTSDQPLYLAIDEKHRDKNMTLASAFQSKLNESRLPVDWSLHAAYDAAVAGRADHSVAGVARIEALPPNTIACAVIPDSSRYSTPVHHAYIEHVNPQTMSKATRKIWRQWLANHVNEYSAGRFTYRSRERISDHTDDFGVF